MEQETVLILLLLKPMTKTSQLNDIAIMRYHGGYPVLKISISWFLSLFWWKSHERQENKTRNCIIIETNDTNKSTKWKIQGTCFQTHTKSQIAFQDGGLKVSFHGLLSVC